MSPRSLRVPTPVFPVAALALLALGSCSGAAEDAPRRPGDVLLITIDTLRPDHMGLYGYERPTTPHIDRWFGGGAIYERAYSTEANTSPSVVSMLTGQLPQNHRIRLIYQLLGDQTSIVTDYLPDAWQTAAFVSNTVLTDEALGMAHRFDVYDDFVDESEPYRVVYERSARRTTDAVLRWLEEEHDPDRPLFLWVHYIDPHGPYKPPGEWERRFEHAEPRPIDLARVPPYTREPGVSDGLAYVDSYDEEIAYLDQQVGRLLDACARRLPIDDALVVFTADHGESMMEHENWFSHGYQAYEEIVRVPLMLRGPGVPAGTFGRLSSGIDLLPTMLRFAGVEVPPHLRGHDLREPEAIPPGRVVFAEATQVHAQWRTAIRADAKWMVGLRRGERDPFERRFYDLETDPDELAPVAWPSTPGLTEAGAELLLLCRSDPDAGGLPASAMDGVQPTAPKVDPRVGEDALKRLEKLGYAGYEGDDEPEVGPGDDSGSDARNP